MTLTDVVGKEKLTVSLDLDNTAMCFTAALRDFVSAAPRFTTDDSIRYLPEPDTYTLDSWQWDRTAYKGVGDAFTAAESSGTLYSSMKAHFGVADAVSAIQGAGHSVVVITARDERFADETMTGLEIAGISPDGVYFSADKYQFHTSVGGFVDVFIDDSPACLVSLADRGMPAVAFHNLYNVGLPAVERLYAWSEAPALVGV